MSHFATALSLQALALEIDWQHGIPNKAAHVETLHAMAREIAGDRATVIYPEEVLNEK